jgi:hypothetical protein
MFNIFSNSINIYVDHESMHVKLTVYRPLFVTHFKFQATTICDCNYQVARECVVFMIFLLFLLLAVKGIQASLERHSCSVISVKLQQNKSMNGSSNYLYILYINYAILEVAKPSGPLTNTS